MPQHVDERVGDGGEHPCGHLRLRHPQLGVDAGDDDVEPVEEVGLLVEGAVVEDVHLDAGEYAEPAVEGLVQGGDLVELGAQPVGGEPVGDGEPRRVVGDDEVVVAEVDRGLDHLGERGAAVGGVGVRMTVAAQGLAQRDGGLVERGVLGGAQASKVDGLLAGERLLDAARRHLPDTFQPDELARPGQLRQLLDGLLPQHRRRPAERANAVRGLVRALQQERDAAQIGDGVAGLAHVGDCRRWAVSAASGVPSSSRRRPRARAAGPRRARPSRGRDRAGHRR